MNVPATGLLAPLLAAAPDLAIGFVAAGFAGAGFLAPVEGAGFLGGIQVLWLI